MSDLETTVATHSADIAHLRERQMEHERLIKELKDGETEILTKLGMSATHEDILTLHTKIDHSINGLLRDSNKLLQDALNAVPQHAANT